MIEKLTASFCLLKKELLLITADSVCGFVLSKVLSNTDVVGGIAMMEMIVLVHCTRRSLLALGFPRASGFTLRQVRAARYQLHLRKGRWVHAGRGERRRIHACRGDGCWIHTFSFGLFIYLCG